MTDELLRPADVEATYGNGLNARTLERLRRDGGGPAWFGIGRRVIYRRSDVDAWLAQQTRRAS